MNTRKENSKNNTLIDTNTLKDTNYLLTLNTIN
jgi:hypothetical protein